MTDQSARTEPPRATEKPAEASGRRVPLRDLPPVSEALPTWEPISTQERLEEISRKLDRLIALVEGGDGLLSGKPTEEQD